MPSDYITNKILTFHYFKDIKYPEPGNLYRKMLLKINGGLKLHLLSRKGKINNNIK